LQKRNEIIENYIANLYYVTSRGGRVIAYGCPIRRKLVGRLWSIYIQRELLNKHAKLICDILT